MGHHRFHFLDDHTLFDRALHTNQTNTVLILQELTNGTNTTVTEVVDIVCFVAVFTVTQIDQVTDNFHQVDRCQDCFGEWRFEIKLVVQFESTNVGEVVALRVEEQVIEEVGSRFHCWGLTGTETSVDLHNGLFRRVDLVEVQGITQKGTDIHVVNVQNLEGCDTTFDDLFEDFRRDLFVDFGEDVTFDWVEDVFGCNFPDHIIFVDRNACDTVITHFTKTWGGDLGSKLLANFHQS